MADQRTPESGRLEQILKSVDHFKPVATRRNFMTKMLLVGGSAAVGAASLGKITTAFAASSPVLDFVNAAVGAERIGIAFYGNALGTGSPYSTPGDPATQSLLDAAHTLYFRAAFNQETSHLATLVSSGGAFPFGHFDFPEETFKTAPRMLKMGLGLESIFIGAYLGAVKAGATDGTALGIFVAEAAAQICGIECEHRVLINDINGARTPNNRFYEGDIGSPPSGALGDTGKRSVVYAKAGDAVNALLALGITPSA
ncbi:MAG: ferritin-like domain-containing protein [Candidatus Dormibacteraeota bacterium]|nr:ferritin-like domain-containing protein [Candidatus Dormibacteraeota bacterium]